MSQRIDDLSAYIYLSWCSSDAGVPVYLYEFVHRPEVHNRTRPSFVKADHADEVGFMFGGCFWEGHIKITGMLAIDAVDECYEMCAWFHHQCPIRFTF